MWVLVSSLSAVCWGRWGPCYGKPCTAFKRLRNLFLVFSGSLFPPQLAVCYLTVGWTCVHSHWLILMSWSLIPTFFIIFYTDKTLCFSEPFLYVIFYLILSLTLLNRWDTFFPFYLFFFFLETSAFFPPLIIHEHWLLSPRKKFPEKREVPLSCLRGLT